MVRRDGGFNSVLYNSLRDLQLTYAILIFSVDVFNFLQPVLENNLNNDMSVAKIVETCRQEVSVTFYTVKENSTSFLTLSDVTFQFEILWHFRKAM